MVEFTQTHYISSYVKDDHLTYIGCTCGWMTVSPQPAGDPAVAQAPAYA